MVINDDPHRGSHLHCRQEWDKILRVVSTMPNQPSSLSDSLVPSHRMITSFVWV